MELEIDVKGLDGVKRMLDPKLIDKVTVRTINDVAKLGRTAASKEIRGVYNINITRLNEGLQKVQHWRRATLTKKQAVIRAVTKTSNWPGLVHYGAKEVRKGVSYKVLKKGGRKTLRNAFWEEDMPGGGFGIFKRHGPKVIMTRGRYAGKKRQRIVRKTGPPITKMMEKVGLEVAIKKVNNEFFRLFKRNQAFYLSRIKR